jgi:hypothetical protein
MASAVITLDIDIDVPRINSSSYQRNSEKRRAFHQSVFFAGGIGVNFCLDEARLPEGQSQVSARRRFQK